MEKIKKLLDCGAITQEEYDQHKKIIMSRDYSKNIPAVTADAPLGGYFA